MKKIIMIVMVIVNVILGIVLLINVIGAYDKLKFEYVEEGTIGPENLRSYLDRENYGVVAGLASPIRGGAEVDAADEDYYRLGEYAELLFLKEIFAKAGNTDTYAACEERLGEIREGMSDYGVIFDKIDLSVENAIVESE